MSQTVKSSDERSNIIGRFSHLTRMSELYRYLKFPVNYIETPYIYISFVYQIDHYSFLQRSIRRNRQYTCKSRGTTVGSKSGMVVCRVDKSHRNQCRACRLTKCLEVGMNKDGKLLFILIFFTHLMFILSIYLLFLHY